jgi:hypothetical protein
MKLSEDNFTLFAASNYDNIQCANFSEFQNDLKKFTYINKLFARYEKEGDLKERLILNHIIILYNLFGSNLNEMLFLKIEQKYWSLLATFLVYLNRLPENMLSEFVLNQDIINALRKI